MNFVYFISFSLTLAAATLAAAAASRDIDGELLSFLKSSAYGRKKVIDLIVNEYTSGSHPDQRRIGRLDDAFKAIGIAETDGEPIPVKGLDSIFIGSVGASLNEKSLHQNGITHVINWSSTARCDVFDGFEYHCIAMTSKNQMIEHIEDLDQAVDLVESVRKSGGKILSHCWYGRNRSVTLVVAYLMKYEGMTAAEATDVVRETRPQADPWWGPLEYYSSQYLQVSNVASEQQKLQEWKDGTRTRALRGAGEGQKGEDAEVRVDTY